MKSPLKCENLANSWLNWGQAGHTAVNYRHFLDISLYELHAEPTWLEENWDKKIPFFSTTKCGTLDISASGLPVRPTWPPMPIKR
jgi:hypothetical protein